MTEYTLPQSKAPKFRGSLFILLAIICAFIVSAVMMTHRPRPNPEQYLSPAVEPDHSNVNAAENLCGSAHDLASTASNLQVQLTVRNSQNVPYEVYWIDFQGQHKHYATIYPGSRYVVQSYYGHRWAVYSGGNCYMIITLGTHDFDLHMAAADDPALRSTQALQ